MSDAHSIGLAQDSNPNQFVRSQEYHETSVREQSVHNLELHPSSNLKQQAILFYQSYEPIDDTFPIATIKISASLRVKHYKESIYYGEFNNGKKNGAGVMVYHTGKIYQGLWENDKKKGYGVQRFPNGCCYRGQYSNGKPEGTGSYEWPNGEYYDGQWRQGEKHGSGMWRGEKGDSYKGQWRLGKPDGEGVYTWINGDNYEGQFKDCLKHGKGVQKFANGDMYRGTYVNGKPSGHGDYYWSNGSYFKGNFTNGLRDGKGIWKRGTGNSDRYQGFYKNDKKWGTGVFTWASGNVYKGSYEGDMRNGMGEMYWTNGSFYKGQWLNGVQNGEGEIYIPGQGYKRGRFDNNVIVEVYQEKREQMQKQGTKQSVSREKTMERQSQKKRVKSREKTKISQQQFRLKTKTTFRSRPNNRTRQISVTQEKRELFTRQKLNQKEEQPPKWRYGLKQKTSVRARVLKDRKSVIGINMVSQQKRFASKSQRPNQVKMRTMDFDLMKSTTKVQQGDKKPQSKQRLLHSSFYLYKLNARHSMEVSKNIKKNLSGREEQLSTQKQLRADKN